MELRVPPPQYAQFSEAENDRLRAALQAVMTDRRWSASRAAREMGLAPNTVTVFLRRINGAGESLARGIEALTGRSRDELLGRTKPSGVRLDTIPQWADLVAQCQAHFSDLPPDAYAYVGTWTLPEPVELDFVTLHLLATGAVRTRSPSSPGMPAVRPPPSHPPAAGPSDPSNRPKR